MNKLLFVIFLFGFVFLVKAQDVSQRLSDSQVRDIRDNKAKHVESIDFFHKKNIKTFVDIDNEPQLVKPNRKNTDVRETNVVVVDNVLKTTTTSSRNNKVINVIEEDFDIMKRKSLESLLISDIRENNTIKVEN